MSETLRFTLPGEWALIVGDGPDDLLLTAACDHTDRALEVHGVAWSKQSAPDLLGDVAWPLAAIEHELDAFTLKAWVRHGEREQLIQDGTRVELTDPRGLTSRILYSVERLAAAWE
ncbi:DUF2848 family protein [Kribbella sp. VKM Ac-2568]|uniref:DUF2848 family protein n=1 Tax=Kribbella sp. VKM Ac-2568 TaxID=2512219 RepID=UPI0010E7BDDB|nr:DUF2848 family protein [Kribbella sp. VKM Ac-2568]TCM44162.1 uncharacterized protein DUF2848 [Kribbella sp. VKM Ac-2568]